MLEFLFFHELCLLRITIERLVPLSFLLLRALTASIAPARYHVLKQTVSITTKVDR